MNLRDYYAQLSKDERKRLADDLGIKMGYLLNVVSGCKPVSRYLALALEQATRGLLKRQELRPDLFK